MTAYGTKSNPAGLADLTREELQCVIERLAKENEFVAQRVQYLVEPQAVVHDIALRIATLRRTDYSHDGAAAERLGDDLSQLLTDIEQDVLPRHPVQALALAESLLYLDGRLIKHETDHGSICKAFSGACILWLKAGRAARDRGCLPLMDWPVRLIEVLRHESPVESFFTRSSLLQQATLLLDAVERKRVTQHYTDIVRHKLERWRSRCPGVTLDDLSFDRRRPAPAPTLPSERPLAGGRIPVGELERAEFYLDCGDLQQAQSMLLSLKTRRAPSDPVRILDLLDRACGQLGETASRIEIRRERFYLKPDLASYLQLEELLDDPALQTLRGELALRPPPTRDEFTWVFVLFAAGLSSLAQNFVFAQAKAFEVEGPTPRLVALGMVATGSPLAATVVWRALLNSVLKDGKSADYSFGTKLFAELQRLDTEIDDYYGLPTHAEYVAAVYERHGPKVKFWHSTEPNVGTPRVSA